MILSVNLLLNEYLCSIGSESCIETLETNKLIKLSRTEKVSCNTVACSRGRDRIHGEWIKSGHEFEWDIGHVENTAIIDVASFETEECVFTTGKNVTIEFDGSVTESTNFCYADAIID